MRFFLVLLLTYVAPLVAQSVTVYSEFQRIDPFGHVVSADRSESPREILSPEMPRNGHTAFHVAVTAPQNTSYFLYVGSNPPNIVEMRLYKEEFTRIGEQWFPDTLTPLKPPYFGFIPDLSAAIPGQTTRCYLLDIWVSHDIPVQRVRVEVLMKVGVWYVAPMEVRIVEAQVPRHEDAPATVTQQLPAIDEPIDTAAKDCLASYLFGGPQTWSGGTSNIRDVIRRDAEQDMAIARTYGPVPQPLWRLTDDGILQDWMRTPEFNWSGSEWYLRIRDWIFRNP